jgi:hypothetical protein
MTHQKQSYPDGTPVELSLSNEATRTHKAQILAHLQSGHSITPLDALQLFGCFRLGARIYDPRKSGVEILMERRKSVNQNGHRVSFAMYHLKTA